MLFTDDNAYSDTPPIAPSTETLMTRWGQSAKSIRSARIDWTEHTHLEPGSMVGKDAREVDDHGHPFPGSPLDLVCKNSLTIDGTRWCWRRSGTFWENAIERAAQKEYVYVFNGKDFRVFSGIDVREKEWHSYGYIQKAEQSFITAHFPQIAPVLLLLRPFDRAVGPLGDDQWIPAQRIDGKTLRGLDCIEIGFQSRSNGGEKRCLLARDFDWRPIRFSSSKRIEIDLFYDGKNANHHPTRWVFRLKSPDLTDVEESIRGEITSWKENVPVAATAFEVTFPLGTEVFDYTRIVDGLPKSYLVRGDGSHRPITRKERQAGLSYSAIRNSQPNEAVPDRTRDVRLRWLIVAASAAVLVALGVISVIRRHRHTRSTSDDQ